MKEASPERLRTAGCHLDDIRAKGKLWRQSNDQGLPWWGGEGVAGSCEWAERRLLGPGTAASDTMADACHYTSARTHRTHNIRTVTLMQTTNFGW